MKSWSWWWVSRCEMAIGVIKNKIGLPPTLKGAYFISYLEIFPPLSSWAESKEGRKRKISASLVVKLLMSYEMRVARCDDVMMWWCDDVMMWWCDDVMMWWCNERYEIAIWSNQNKIGIPKPWREPILSLI